MTRIGRDPKKNKGRGNTDKSNIFSHCRPSNVGKKIQENTN